MAGKRRAAQAAALDAGGESKLRRAAAGSPENRVNTIPTTILTRVWLGRKRAWSGMRLGDWEETPGAGEDGETRHGGDDRGAAAKRERGEEEGKQTGEDPHPKVEL
jgi:hypothetical protein